VTRSCHRPGSSRGALLPPGPQIGPATGGEAAALELYEVIAHL
jgi:hypothetical protein